MWYVFKYIYKTLFITNLQSSISEALRKYPTIATLHRIANTDYTMPDGAILPKGTFIIIPSYAIHHDPEIYPLPENFDPERFSEEGRQTRHPYSYLPFGEGPRICVGLRFGMMQAKIGLAMLLSNFRFSTCPKTEIPLKIDQVYMLFVPQNGVWLKIEALV